MFLRRLLLQALACALFCSQAAGAGELSLRGFGTLGLVHANDDTLVYLREISQYGENLANNPWRRDSRLGLQVNYAANPQWEFVAQFLAREKNASTLANSFEWAFVKYRPTPEWDLRAGRVGIDLFLLSDHRSVGYTYPWVRPPLEFYGEFALASLDGIDIAHRWEIGDGQLRGKVFAGRTSTSLPLWTGSIPFSMQPMVGGSAEYESGAWRLRANLTQGRITSRYLVPDELVNLMNEAAPWWPGGATLMREFEVKDTRMRYASLGAGYDDGTWQVLAEISRTTAQRLVAPIGNRAYVSVGRRWGNWMPYVLIATANDKRHVSTSAPLTPLLAPLQEAALTAINRQQVRQSAWGVGARWDLAPNMALKLQFDRARIPADGLLLWYVKPGKDWQGGHRNLWSASLDFVF